MGVQISNLVLEITRHCNMLCDHCLRGEPQNKQIDYKVIENLLDQTEYISSITFTGGEPTLNIPALKFFVEELKKRGKTIGNFFIVTNGKIVPKEFLTVLMELFLLCDDMCLEDGIGGLEVSNDQYHDSPSKDIKIYEVFSFFRKDARGDINYWGVINEGRAATNGIGYREESLEDWDIEEYDDNIHVSNSLYVSYRGDVVRSCDLSYERIDSEADFNILETTIEEKLHRILEEETCTA